MTRLRADLLLLTAALIWGTAFIAQKAKSVDRHGTSIPVANFSGAPIDRSHSASTATLFPDQGQWSQPCIPVFNESPSVFPP